MRLSAVLCAALCFTGAAVQEAHADGTIILNSAQNFQSKLNDGTITGADSSQTNDPQHQATNMALGTAFPGAPSWQTTSLSASSPAANASSSLVSSAVSPGGQPQTVGAWTFGYHIDPDLTNYTADLKLYLPEVGVYGNGVNQSGINLVTLTLTSAYLNGSNQTVYGSRVWGFDNTLAPGILGPSASVREFRIGANHGSGAGGSNFFEQDSTFRLDQVLYVSVGYRGYLGADYPANPDSAASPGALWLGTESLNITATPEPGGPILFLLLSTGTTLLLKRSRQVRARRKASLRLTV